MSKLLAQLQRRHHMRVARRMRRTWYRISRDSMIPESKPAAIRIACAERKRMRKLLRQIRNNL